MSSRPIYVSTNSLPGLPLEVVLAECADIGLARVELSSGGAPAPTDLDRVLQAHRSTLQYVLHNYFPAPAEPFVLNLAASEERLLARSMDLCRSAIELSAGLGAAFYSVHAGFRAELAPDSLGGPLQHGPVRPYESAYRVFVTSVRRLAALGRERGVRVLVEPNVLAPFNLVEGCNELALICEAWEVENLIRDTEDPGLGILLDTGHLNVTSRTLGFDRMDFLRRVAPFVGAVHVHDNDGRADTHQPVSPGSWVLDALGLPGLAELPLIVEARFGSITELNNHVSWLSDHV